ncbi:MAG: ATP-dependent DNA ligase [Myxococcales bacterium]|nr:ATP-dependent DNA ligase [Myxococcales bacterium]
MTLFTVDSARPLGKGKQSPAGSITDADMAAMVRNYKRVVAGSYRSLVFEDLATPALPGGNLLVSPKIDGEMWFLVLGDGPAFLASPTGRVVSGDVPVLTEATALAGKVQGRTVLAGELFAVKPAGQGRPRVGDLAAVMGGEDKAQVERMAFVAFDLVVGGDAEAPQRSLVYSERLDVLRRLLAGGKRVQAIKTEAASGSERVLALWNEWVEGGKGEGLVLRTGDNFVYKAKPSITLDAVIIGYTDSSDDPDGVGALLMAMMREDGQFQIIGSCGNMPTEVRQQFKKALSGKEIASNYRYANSKGALYRFVRPETVIEFKVTDVQGEDSSGESILRMVLEHSERGWTVVRELPGASILHPVFVRVRDDKQVNKTDIRVAQVLERCLVEGLGKKAEKVVLPASTVVRREVYVKAAKGQSSVRKLVVWKTNKETVDRSYPAFVVHWTDYSPGRKDPLQREVRVAPTLADAIKIGDDMIAENVKKGWDRHA